MVLIIDDDDADVEALDVAALVAVADVVDVTAGLLGTKCLNTKKCEKNITKHFKYNIVLIMSSYRTPISACKRQLFSDDDRCIL